MTKVTDDGIIETAIQLFKQTSYDNVKVTDICTACKITKRAFYYHFENKDQLISAYFRKLVVQVPMILKTQDSDLNPLKSIYEFYHQNIEVINTSGPDLYRQLYHINLDNDQHAFDFSESSHKYVTELIQTAQTQHLIENMADPDELFTSSVLLFEAIQLNWCFQQASFDTFPYVKRNLEILFQVPFEHRDPDLQKFQLYQKGPVRMD
jgi:AcrR family transcriptional regulator